MVISGFTGLVLYLFQDLSCLVKVLIFCSNSSVIFSAIGRKVFSVFVFEGVYYLKGLVNKIQGFIVLFSLNLGVLVNLYYHLSFLFLLEGRSLPIQFLFN